MAARLFGNLLSTTFLGALLLVFILSGVEGSHGHGRHNKPMLFVFGDSYADTGNINKAVWALPGWKSPYGITWPGQPFGRFSDGHILTDFIAKFSGLKSPIQYSNRKLGSDKVNHGVNFAFGGTGVFNTTATIAFGLPNMTTQIDFFQHMLSGNDIVHIDHDLTHSIAYVSVVGNDHNTFLSTGGTVQDLPTFIAKVVNQMAINMQRLLGLGIRKILVTGLQPLGCVPQKTVANSFKQCNATFNSVVQFHNLLLRKAVSNLNNQTTGTPIHVLDLYDSFFTAFQTKNARSGGLKFETPLKPCCFGINSNLSCGDVDANGNKLYTLCDDRSAAFFWDSYHPTQEGWKAVYPHLKTTLKQVIY